MDFSCTDDHKLLGVVIERDVIILLDISSSVSPYWTEMRKGLLDLLHMFPPKVKTYGVIHCTYMYLLSRQCISVSIASVS